MSWAAWDARRDGKPAPFSSDSCDGYSTEKSYISCRSSRKKAKTTTAETGHTSAGAGISYATIIKRTERNWKKSRACTGEAEGKKSMEVDGESWREREGESSFSDRRSSKSVVHLIPTALCSLLLILSLGCPSLALFAVIVGSPSLPLFSPFSNSLNRPQIHHNG